MAKDVPITIRDGLGTAGTTDRSRKAQLSNVVPTIYVEPRMASNPVRGFVVMARWAARSDPALRRSSPHNGEACGRLCLELAVRWWPPMAGA